MARRGWSPGSWHEKHAQDPDGEQRGKDHCGHAQWGPPLPSLLSECLHPLCLSPVRAASCSGKALQWAVLFSWAWSVRAEPWELAPPWTRLVTVSGKSVTQGRWLCGRPLPETGQCPTANHLQGGRGPTSG